MRISINKYFEVWCFLAISIVFSSCQNMENTLYSPPLLQENSAHHRSRAIQKTTIINDISNHGQFKFEARYNHNQVIIEGSLYNDFNGTKELLINGLARVVLISKGFNTHPGGIYEDFESYDQFEYSGQCSPMVGSGIPAVPIAGVGLKAVKTILG